MPSLTARREASPSPAQESPVPDTVAALMPAGSGMHATTPAATGLCSASRIPDAQMTEMDDAKRRIFDLLECRRSFHETARLGSNGDIILD
jgi:hypothetical protein